MSLRKDVVEFVEDKERHISFAELSKIDGFMGEPKCLFGRPDMNIYYWFGMSHDACDVMEELFEQEMLTMEPANLLVYMADGMVPDVPVAKKCHAYKSNRWLPVVVSPTPNFFNPYSPSAET